MNFKKNDTTKLASGGHKGDRTPNNQLDEVAVDPVYAHI